MKESEKTLQNYNSIIQHYKKTNEKYSDPDFIAENGQRLEKYYNTDIFKNISQDGIRQGSFPDCFLLCCCIQLASNIEYIKQLFVDPLDLNSGAACIRFKCMDKPFYIIIDTLVPFSGNHPSYARPVTEEDSCWFCLIEKAYAKLMGGWDKISGNSADAMNVMFSFFKKTEKLNVLSKQPWERLNEFLNETPFVFSSIITNQKCTEIGLETNHGYAVIGIDTVNNEKLIHLKNPHNVCFYNGPYSSDSNNWKPGQKEKVKFRENGHFWIPSTLFNKYFDSIACSIPLKKGWISHSLEFDIQPGEDDGRFFAGNGPYVGHLPQWLVTFPKKTNFHLYCVAASESSNVLGLAMCQNNGNKISYKKVDDVPIKYAMDGSEIIDFCVASIANSPYTLVISRKQASEKPVHIYCRIESPVDFKLEQIKDPDFSSLNHVEAHGTLKPGSQDGRSKYGNSSLDPVPQWNLTLSKPGRIFIVAHKDNHESQHTFFIAVPSFPGKYSKGGSFYQGIIMAPKCSMEQDFVDLNNCNQYICVGMTREKAKNITNFSFDIYSTSKLELKPITGKSSHQKPLSSNPFEMLDELEIDIGDQKQDSPKLVRASNQRQTHISNQTKQKAANTNSTSSKTSHPPTRSLRQAPPKQSAINKTNHNQPAPPSRRPPSKQSTINKTNHNQPAPPSRRPPSKQSIINKTTAFNPKPKPQGAPKSSAGGIAALYKMMEDL